MTSAACSLYALFIVSAAGTLLGIATLVLACVFKYIGFSQWAFTRITCTDLYLNYKYNFSTLQIQTSFIGICLGLLMNIIVLILLVLTIKNLRSLNNNENPEQNQSHISDQVISKQKYSLIYILLAFGTLGNIVCFSRYLTFIIQAKRDPTTCQFSYNQTDLLVLLIIAGVWLLSFIILQILIFKVKTHYIEDAKQEQTKNKYVQMINVTQQIDGQASNMNQESNKKEELFKYSSFVDQIKADKVDEPRNSQYRRMGRGQQYRMNDRTEANRNQPTGPMHILTTQTQNQMNTRQTYKSPNSKNQYHVNIQGENNRVLGQSNQPYKKNVEQIRANPGKQSFKDYKERQLHEANRQQKIFQSTSQPYINKPEASSRGQNIGSLSNKIYSPERGFNNTPSRGRIFDESIKQSRFDDGQRNLNRAKQEVRGYADPRENNKNFQRSPQHQRALNTGVIKPSFGDEHPNEDTKGQLIFYKKGQQSSRNDYPVRNDKFSSGQVSFKSPSRFDNKFAEQQKNYLNRNANNNSILPRNSEVSQMSPNSRRKYIEGYSSGFNNSSRNQEVSPSQSRSKTKSRQGVLTNFIRGKFN